MMRHIAWTLTALLGAFAYAADAPPETVYPLWDGWEPIADYAKRADLSLTKTLELGGGTTLQLTLIPPGTFIRGTPLPAPVEEEAYLQNVFRGQLFLGVSAAALATLVGFVLVCAVREHRRPQYSLAQYTAMTVLAGGVLLGAMHWQHSANAFAAAKSGYEAASARYNSGSDAEKPAQDVRLTRPFYIGIYEVTQEQYQQVMGVNPSRFKGARLPVEMVSRNDAQKFCRKVSEKTESIVRLPTAAEWEYVCRAGSQSTYGVGDGETVLGHSAWYKANSGGATHPVGQKAPNAWGVYDMLGNVWEWCQGYYEVYREGTAVDPKGPTDGSAVVLRGGSWGNDAVQCRCAYRLRINPELSQLDLRGVFGFRVVMTAPVQNP
jgi:formylglycine-generating enzyme required for sulfatase activity